MTNDELDARIMELLAAEPRMRLRELWQAISGRSLEDYDERSRARLGRRLQALKRRGLVKPTLTTGGEPAWKPTQQSRRLSS